MKTPVPTILTAAALLVLPGCVTLAFKGADVGSQRMAREESAEQEANEGPGEHLVEETGKTLQKGIQPINKAKRNAREAVRNTVD